MVYELGQKYVTAAWHECRAQPLAYVVFQHACCMHMYAYVWPPVQQTDYTAVDASLDASY